MAINTNYNILTIGGIGNVLVSDLYVYNDILTSKEVNNNYRDNLILITDNLVSGYNIKFIFLNNIFIRCYIKSIYIYNKIIIFSIIS